MHKHQKTLFAVQRDRLITSGHSIFVDSYQFVNICRAAEASLVFTALTAGGRLGLTFRNFQLR